jgi:hypothetical protein
MIDSAPRLILNRIECACKPQEDNMQAVILLSMLAMGLAMASSSFGQSVDMMPSRAYDAQGYADEAPVARWSMMVDALIAVLVAASSDQDAQAPVERARCHPLIL